jgi:hypothetical protein
MDRLDHANRKPGFTAFAAWARAASGFVASGIYSVLAAQALSPDAGDEDPNVLSSQLGQSFAAQFGD